jgi:hypothetical protein
MEEEAAAKHKGTEGGGGGGEGGEGHVRVKRMMKRIINHLVTKRILSHILLKKGGRKLIQGTQRSSSQPMASGAHQQAIPNEGGIGRGGAKSRLANGPLNRGFSPLNWPLEEEGGGVKTQKH